jgi:hypothetical protein
MHVWSKCSSVTDKHMDGGQIIQLGLIICPCNPQRVSCRQTGFTLSGDNSSHKLQYVLWVRTSVYWSVRVNAMGALEIDRNAGCVN